MRITIAMAALGMVACSTGRAGVFKDQAIVWRVDDERNIPEPKTREYYSLSHHVNGFVFDRLADGVDPPARGPARDTNALDEVPDSSWFTNRIGVRALTPDEALHGAEHLGRPQPPLTVVRAKRGGDSPGFFVEDSRGAKYLMKFDTLENPEQQTGTGAAVGRILWAAGYFTPAEHVIYFHRGDLRIAPAVAAVFDERRIDKALSTATRRADGAIRAVVSEFVPGKPKGGWSPKGRRDDDANDTIDHQHRRVLRGLRVFAAWLGHTDVKPDNTLDVYVDDQGRRFLRHYLVDFGEAFGGHQSGKVQLEVGWEYGLDLGAQSLGLITFGLWVRDWEHQRPTPWKSVGYFGADHFEPREWRERYPYEPFIREQRDDAYWAAKIIMRFDRPLLEALVAEAEFTENGASEYIVSTLLARRDAIGRAYLDRVTPLDDLAIQNTQLCATDLTRKYGLARDGTVEVIGAERAVYAVGVAGRVCLSVIGDGTYRVLRVRIRRADHSTPPMQIHYRAGVDAKILGVVRE